MLAHWTEHAARQTKVNKYEPWLSVTRLKYEKVYYTKRVIPTGMHRKISLFVFTNNSSDLMINLSMIAYLF